MSLTSVMFRKETGGNPNPNPTLQWQDRSRSTFLWECKKPKYGLSQRKQGRGAKRGKHGWEQGASWSENSLFSSVPAVTQRTLV